MWKGKKKEDKEEGAVAALNTGSARSRECCSIKGASFFLVAEGIEQSGSLMKNAYAHARAS
jgi:hypothetical protein